MRNDSRKRRFFFLQLLTALDSIFKIHHACPQWSLVFIFCETSGSYNPICIHGSKVSLSQLLVLFSLIRFRHLRIVPPYFRWTLKKERPLANTTFCNRARTNEKFARSCGVRRARKRPFFLHRENILFMRKKKRKERIIWKNREMEKSLERKRAGWNIKMLTELSFEAQRTKGERVSE